MPHVASKTEPRPARRIERGGCSFDKYVIPDLALGGWWVNYHVTCLAHGQETEHETRPAALEAMREPELWCSQCDDAQADAAQAGEPIEADIGGRLMWVCERHEHLHEADQDRDDIRADWPPPSTTWCPGCQDDAEPVRLSAQERRDLWTARDQVDAEPSWNAVGQLELAL
jgi:hypothetical protein